MIFSNMMVVDFIGDGNRKTHGKTLITLDDIEYTWISTGVELKHLRCFM